jgi:hypothetical protein
MLNTLKNFAKAMLSPQVMIPFALALVATPAMASSANSTNASSSGAVSAINSLTQTWGLPILTAISGMAWCVGAIGHMFQPDKRALFQTLSGVGVVGIVGGGGAMTIGGLISQSYGAVVTTAHAATTHAVASHAALLAALQPH